MALLLVSKTAQTTPPSDLPSLDSVRAALRIFSDETSEDAALKEFLDDAVDWAETYTGQLLRPTRVVQNHDCFENFRLVGVPFRAAVSLQYKDANDATQTLVYGVDYFVRYADGFCEIRPTPGTSWPGSDAIIVTYDAGYTELPASLRRGVVQLVAYFDANRGDAPADLPKGVMHLLDGYKRIG